MDDEEKSEQLTIEDAIKRKAPYVNGEGAYLPWEEIEE